MRTNTLSAFPGVFLACIFAALLSVRLPAAAPSASLANAALISLFTDRQGTIDPRRSAAATAAQVQAAIFAGADPNVRFSDGDTPLMAAAYGANLDCVKVLLNHAATVNAQGRSGLTALMAAGLSGNTDVFSYLAAHGANVKEKNLSGDSAIEYASSVSDLKICVAGGANVNEKGEKGYTPLMESVASAERVSYLLRRGADANAVGDDGETAVLLLFETVVDSDARQMCLELLTANGARVDRAQADGSTPLMWAALGGDAASVRLLLEKHAPVNVQDTDGKTALMYAVTAPTPEHSPTADEYQLMKLGGITAQNMFMRKEVCGRASAAGKVNCLKRILAAGADTSIVDHDGETALSTASGQPDAVKLLLPARSSAALSQPAGVGAVGTVEMPTGAYTMSAPTGETTAGILNTKITSASTIYYLIGDSSAKVPSALAAKPHPDGSISVPILHGLDDPGAAGWGPSDNGLRIGITVSSTEAAIGQPLFGEVIIDNKSDKSFEMRYGCGPNMDLALPSLVNGAGKPVARNFTIGQGACAATWGYDVAAGTTAVFLFNITDLYDILAPGEYTMAITLPDTDFVLPMAKRDRSGRVKFKVTPG